jgi:hypothetical protein
MQAISKGIELAEEAKVEALRGHVVSGQGSGKTLKGSLKG